MSTERVTPPPYGLKSYELLHLSEDERRFYREIADNRAIRKLVQELIVAARTGKAFPVGKGRLLRVECHEDAQVADTVDHRPTPRGGRPHDILFGMCDERLYFRLLGRRGLPNCRDNLTGAVAEFGLAPEDVHDPLNIFMTTGLDERGRLFYEPPRAKRGDYMELYADMDCLCAVSACPGASSGPNPGGLKLQIFDIDARLDRAGERHAPA